MVKACEMTSPQALYVGSFGHSSIEFRQGYSAVIREIRVIPRNCKPPIGIGYDCVGLSYPPSFSLEVFAKNGNHPEKGSYQKIGSMRYSETDETMVQCDVLFPTDLIVFRGDYTALTIALIGDSIPPPEPNMSGGSHSSSRKASSRSSRADISPPSSSHRSDRADRSSAPIPSSSSAHPSPILTIGAPIPTIGAAFNPLVPPPLLHSPAYTTQPPPTPQQPLTYFAFDPSRPPPTVPHALVASPIPQQQTSPIRPVPNGSNSRVSDGAPGASPPHGHQKRHQPPPLPPTSSAPRRSSSGEHGGSSRHRSTNSPKNDRPIPSELPPPPAAVVHSRSESGSIADSDEAHSAVDGTTSQLDLEVISDDEWDEITDVNDHHQHQLDITEDDESMLSRTTAHFSPNDLELADLTYFCAPWLTPYERMSDQPNVQTSDLLAALDLHGDDFYNKQSGWLLTMERVIPIIPEQLHAVLAEHPDAVDTILKWLEFGLSEKAAVTQPQPAYIIRHLKVGIRLAMQMFQLDVSIARTLSELKVHHRLLDLLVQDHMALPLKLQLLKALDASVYFAPAVHAFFEQQNDSGLTPYARLVTIVTQKQSSRFLAAARALLRRLSLHGSLNDLRRVISASVEGADFQTATLCSLLQDIVLVYRHADLLTTLHTNSLPVSIVYERSSSGTDSYPAIYRSFFDNHLVPVLCVLCSSESTVNNAKLMATIRKFLDELRSTQHGLEFLASLPSVTQHLVDILLNTQTDEGGGDGDDHGAFTQWGVDLANDLRALQVVDRLLSVVYSPDRPEVDDPSVLVDAHELHALSFTPSGRRSVAKVLSFERNLDAVLFFLDLTGESEQTQAATRKSAGAGYAVELILQVLRYSDSAEMLRNYSEKLLLVGSQDSVPRASVVKQWLEPLKKMPDESTTPVIDYLTERIKAYSEEGVAARIPKGLVTAIRLLKDYVVAKDVDPGVDAPVQVKYLRNSIRLFSNGAFDALIQLLTKLNESSKINWEQGLSFANREGALYYGCVIPILAIVRSMLCHLIDARGSDFKDLTALRPLAQTFSICCTLLPTSSAGAPETATVRAEVLRALLFYTLPEPIGDANSGATSFKDSTWTRTVAEIARFGVESPCYFVGAVTILSEMLPLPLPIATATPLTEEQCAQAMSERLRWSAHLAPIESDLRQLLQFSATTTPTLQNACRRLCLQLVDLGSHMATVVVRALLLLTVKNMVNREGTETVLPVSLSVASLVNLLSYLASHGPFKATLLVVLRSDDFGNFLGRLAEVLAFVSTKNPHLMCQESVVALFSSLCDASIELASRDDSPSALKSEHDDGSCAEEKMDVGGMGEGGQGGRRCLPSLEQCRLICSSLLSHVGKHEHGYATVIPTLRALLLIAQQSSHGLSLIKDACGNDDVSLKCLLSRLVDEFNGHSSDCLSTLSTVLELLNTLLNAAANSQVAHALMWREKHKALHPLTKLIDLLAESAEHDSTMTRYLKDIDGIVAAVGASSPTKQESVEMPEWTEPLSLEEQFQRRKVWILEGSDDQQMRLTAHYWFPTSTLDDSLDDNDGERVGCDLEAIRSEFLPKLNPQEELQKRVSLKHVQRAKSKRARPGIINTAKGDKGKEPLRGRGFQVSRQKPSGNRFDPFRSRPQNTSRAPSMHVDDFLLAEVHHKAGGDVPQHSNHDMPAPKRPIVNSRNSADRNGGGGGGGGVGLGPGSQHRSIADDRRRKSADREAVHPRPRQQQQQQHQQQQHQQQHHQQQQHQSQGKAQPLSHSRPQQPQRQYSRSQAASSSSVSRSSLPFSRKPPLTASKLAVVSSRKRPAPPSSRPPVARRPTAPSPSLDHRTAARRPFVRPLNPGPHSHLQYANANIRQQHRLPSSTSSNSLKRPSSSRLPPSRRDHHSAARPPNQSSSLGSSRSPSASRRK